MHGITGCYSKGRHSDGHYSEKFGSSKCDLWLGLGLEMGLRLELVLMLGLVYVQLFLSFFMLDSDFVIRIEFFGIASFGIVTRNQCTVCDVVQCLFMLGC